MDSDIKSSPQQKQKFGTNDEEPKIIVVDGGFATQLSRHVGQKIDGDALWSTRFLATDKEAIIKTHLDFLRAGANLIITNTYQASIGLFMEHLKLTQEESYDLIKDAVRLAETACDRFLKEFPNARKPLIVGSVGPYGASLHDGSEYAGSYCKTTSPETLREWHTPRIKALIEAGVDLLALETIPCRIEAETLVLLLKEKFPNTKAWLTFSINPSGDSIANGDNFQEAVRYCYDLSSNQLVAIGVNCLAPKFVQKLFTGVNVDRNENPVPLICYPNSGECYKNDVGWTDKDKCLPLETYVHTWLDLGVTWIGGCCRTYAEDISKICVEVKKWQQIKYGNIVSSQ